MATTWFGSKPWLIVNALSRDVERQQLNSILNDINSSVTTVNSLAIQRPTGVEDAVGNMLKGGKQQGIVVTYTPNNKALNFTITPFAIRLTGDITGSGTYDGINAVSIQATFTNPVITDAPTDNQYYARKNGLWVPINITSGVGSLDEIRRRVSMGW